jgi:hypothetical protein
MIQSTGMRSPSTKKSMPRLAPIVIVSGLLFSGFSFVQLTRLTAIAQNERCPVCSSITPPLPTLVGCVNVNDTTSENAVQFIPIEGPGYRIYRPFDVSGDLLQRERLVAPPEYWIAQTEKKYKRMDPMTTGNQDRPVAERSRSAYQEMLKDFVTGLVYGKEEKSVLAKLGNLKLNIFEYEESLREGGLDWTYLGSTMTGIQRINNVQYLISQVVQNNIPGDYLEAGVWRGGSSVFARGVLRSLNQGHRKSYVCDSFQGLPAGDKNLHPDDKNWDKTPYLSVSDIVVATSFREAALLDENVIFARGFFNHTMKPLAKQINSLAILRLDGDMYESTVDVLYHLYDKLSLGGYVIMDDWDNFPSQFACLDFFAAHKFDPDIVRIDKVSVYWQKRVEIKVQYWRYEKSAFKL